jgi:membrane protease YdiL (CAAX protease family)
MEDQTSNSDIAQFKKTIIIGIAFAFLFALSLQIVIPFLNLNYYDKLFYSRFIYWGDAGLLFFYTYKFEHQSFFIWSEKRSGFWFIVQSVFILYLLCIAIGIISHIPSFLGWHDSTKIIKQLTSVMRVHPIMLVFTAFTASVTEELIFRGYLLTRLSIIFESKYIPVLISSILFASLHYGYHSLGEYIFTFLFGILCSVYYQKYKNIMPLIIVHFLIDLIALEAEVYLMK